MIHASRRISGSEHNLHQVRLPRVQPFKPLRPILEGCNRTDERLHLDAACGQEFDALRIFSGGAARSLQPDLPGDGQLQRQRHLGGDVPDKRDRASLANARYRGANRGIDAHRFEGDIHPTHRDISLFSAPPCDFSLFFLAAEVSRMPNRHSVLQLFRNCDFYKMRSKFRQ